MTTPDYIISVNTPAIPPEPFQSVPTSFGGTAVITATDTAGRYQTASGLCWIWNGNQLEPLPDIRHIVFQVAVSRTYRNKEGYTAGGYKLNISFRNEWHTAASFLETVIWAGWPYCMVHLNRSPEETGAAARGVRTPKHIENFVSSQLLTLDDDSKTAGVVDWWLHDPFFARYGLLFAESVNSKANAQKGHPTFLFDRPIIDAALYKECLQAACTYYPRVDWLVNVDRTLYNGQDAPVHFLGNICPFHVFEREILTPWRTAEMEKQAQIEAARERRRLEYEQAKASGRTCSDDAQTRCLTRFLNKVFEGVAHATSGRNLKIYTAGRCIAGVEATPWARPYLHLLSDVDGRIVDAAAANGYLHEYAHDDENEVLRIFGRGRAAGGEPLEEPISNGSDFKEGEEVTLIIDGVPKAAGRIKALKWRLEDGTWRQYAELEEIT